MPGTSGLIPKRNRLKFLTFNTFATLPFHQEKYLNLMTILSTLEFTILDKTIRSFKMIHFSIKMQILELVNLKCLTLIHTTHSSVLMSNTG